MFKNFVKKLFGLFGLKVSRKTKSSTNKYFNTGNLAPLEENSKELYDKFYGDHKALKEYYKGFRINFYQTIIDELITENVVFEDKKILDVGCGVGFLLNEISDKFSPYSLSGTDFSKEAINASKRYFPKINFFQHDIYDPLPEKYDFIICTEVLEHLEYPHNALNNLTQALNNNGNIAISVPNGRIDTINEHINFWSPESWKVFLERENPDAIVKTSVINEGLFNFALLKF